MVAGSGGVVFIYRVVDGECRRYGAAGLGDSRGVMVSHMMEAWSGAMVAPTTCMSRAMRIFALKMGQRLLTVMTSEART
jgi:hypothetical protein